MEAGAGFGVEGVFVGSGKGVVLVEYDGADVAVVAEGLVIYIWRRVRLSFDGNESIRHENGIFCDPVDFSRRSTNKNDRRT